MESTEINMSETGKNSMELSNSATCKMSSVNFSETESSNSVVDKLTNPVQPSPELPVPSPCLLTKSSENSDSVNIDNRIISNIETLGLCANCNAHFENEENKVDTICLQDEKRISIRSVLAYIFEMQRLGDNSLRKSVFGSRNLDDGQYSFCRPCSESLNSLFDTLIKFRNLCAMESLVSKQLDLLSQKIQMDLKHKKKKSRKTGERKEKDYSLQVKLEVNDGECDGDNDEDNFIDDTFGYSNDPGQISDYDDSDYSCDSENREDCAKEVRPLRKSAQKFYSILNQHKIPTNTNPSKSDEESLGSAYSDDDDFNPNSEDEEDDFEDIDPKVENESLDDANNSDNDQPMVPRKTKRKVNFRKSKLKKPSMIIKQEEGSFPCSQCSKYCLTEASLKRHERIHIPEVQAKLTCNQCSKIFSREDHLSRHLLRVHGIKPVKKVRPEMPVREYNCPVCNVQIESKYQDFKQHVSAHGIENPFTCTLCPKAFSSLQRLKSHMKNHNENRPTYHCQVCNSKFSRSYHLSRHQKNKHRVPNNISIESQEIFDLLQPDANNEGSHVCGVCFKVYTRKDKLTTHMLNHTEEAPFSCVSCGKKFFSERGLENHKIIHTDNNPNTCVICKKAFSRPDHLKTHMLRHEKEPKIKTERVFGCEICGKEFKTKANLKMHNYCHTEERPWSCSICGKSFNHPSILGLHAKVHSDERPFCCSICGRTFKLNHHLRDHEAMHADNVPRPFTCEKCGKAFKKLKHVRSHMRVHDESKDHVCNECGKAFSRVDNLRAHVRAVHLNDPTAKRKKKVDPLVSPPLSQPPQTAIQFIPLQPNQPHNEIQHQTFTCLTPFPFPPHININY